MINSKVVAHLTEGRFDIVHYVQIKLKFRSRQFFFLFEGAKPENLWIKTYTPRTQFNQQPTQGLIMTQNLKFEPSWTTFIEEGKL